VDVDDWRLGWRDSEIGSKEFGELRFEFLVGSGEGDVGNFGMGKDEEGSREKDNMFFKPSLSRFGGRLLVSSTLATSVPTGPLGDMSLSCFSCTSVSRARL